MKAVFFLFAIMATHQINAMQEVLSQSLAKLDANLRILATMLETTEIERPHLENFLYYNLDENIFQRGVLQQANNANCGYYALKDTLYTLRALEGSELERKQLPLLLQSNAVYTEDYKVWSKAIDQKRNPAKRVATDWLQGSELEWLYEHKTPNKPTTPLWTIDNINWISADMNYQGLATNAKGLTILDNFRTLENYQYGFLLNNAREYFKKGRTTAGSGHWIGAVVTKKGTTFTYYITDSLNRDRTKSDLVLTLKKFLEQDNLTFIKIISSGIQNYIDTISRIKPAALGNTVPDYTGNQEQAIRTVLRNIDYTIQTAKEKNFFDTQEFIGYKQLLIADLQDIISTGKIPLEFQETVPLWLLELAETD